ncbi:NAD(P)-binding protein [Periconia macrospinosa]|uniref:NAD(P)-binding protein n=1 Tax=Periconia macrospinosa TaxID=97972 RepID=A0A2V1E256_9PLEO|nr:NAD(P)-binding protein [Periconia macrospinosa]
MADYRPAAIKLQEQDLKGKVAIVTGATKGIGRAIALNLASRGCSVLGTYSSPQSAHHFDVLCHTISDLYNAPEVPEQIRGNAPTLKGVVADITSLASVGAVLTNLERDFENKLDILVLNAAYNTRPRVGSASEEDVQKSLTGNLQWPIVLVENLTRHKLFQPSSRVVILSSDRVRDPSTGSSIYNATKAGLEALMRSWALELPLTFPGTTVNAVSVGLTDTPGLNSFDPAWVELVKENRLPKVKVVQGGRMGYPEDIADIVGWLVSEKSRWQSGSVVAANGGAEYLG